MSFLTLNNINKSYGSTKVLNDVSINIEKGEFVCLLGPSGCGKTTLLRILAGLEENHEGTVFISNRDMTNLPADARNFGIVFQSYALFPNMNVYKNIAFGLKNKKMKKDEIDAKVKEVLAMVELEGNEHKFPSQLSGGQQQRVAIARAIALSPDFLLLDEPLSALDAKVRLKLRTQIRQLQKKLGITTIMVTHDQEEALSMADKIVVMSKGNIEQIGSPKEIYQNPQNQFVADFIGTINFISDVHGNSILGIRPEEITVTDKVEGALKGIVKDMEFKGAFYRVEVEHNNNEIKIDVPNHIVEEKQISIKDTVYFSIESKSIVIKGEECA
ncbi:MAG: ABC transporter ATP-binding protein [Peptostreptococcaceae bacterium]